MSATDILVIILIAVIAAVIVGLFLPGPAALLAFLIVIVFGLLRGGVRV